MEDRKAIFIAKIGLLFLAFLLGVFAGREFFAVRKYYVNVPGGVACSVINLDGNKKMITSYENENGHSRMFVAHEIRERK